MDRFIGKILKKLYRNKQIVIKPADKNLGLTIMDVQLYNDMCLLHLSDTSTYCLQSSYCSTTTLDLLDNLLREHGHWFWNNKKRTGISSIAKCLCQFAGLPSTREAGYFYVIPKIHKLTGEWQPNMPLPCRPIVSMTNTLLVPASQYVDQKLRPCLSKISTICNGTGEVLRKLTLHESGVGNDLLCADVTSLYTNIPTKKGISAVCAICRK